MRWEAAMRQWALTHRKTERKQKQHMKEKNFSNYPAAIFPTNDLCLLSKSRYKNLPNNTIIASSQVLSITENREIRGNTTFFLVACIS